MRFLSFVLILSTFAAATVRSQHLVLTTADTYPYAAADGDAYYNAVLTTAFGRLGIDLEIRYDVPSERSLRDANRGVTDGEFGRAPGMETAYPNLRPVPFPLAQIRYVAYTRGGDICVASFEDLVVVPIAYINGWKSFEQNVANAQRVDRVDSEEQLFRMLFAGRTDAVLYSRAQGRAFLRRRIIPNRAKEGPVLLEQTSHLYVNAIHEPLIPAIVSALVQMEREGVLDSISRRYLGRPYNP